MADNAETTETTETTTASASGVLDLRPPKESLKAELYRLGLRFTFAQDAGEVWQDDSRGVRATFDDTGQSVLLEDIVTHVTRTLTLDELKGVTRIDTMTAAD